MYRHANSLFLKKLLLRSWVTLYINFPFCMFYRKALIYYQLEYRHYLDGYECVREKHELYGYEHVKERHFVN